MNRRKQLHLMMKIWAENSITHQSVFLKNQMVWVCLHLFSY